MVAAGRLVFVCSVCFIAHIFLLLLLLHFAGNTGVRWPRRTRSLKQDGSSKRTFMETRRSQMSREDVQTHPLTLPRLLDASCDSIKGSFHKGASLFLHSGTTLLLNVLTPVSCLPC